MARRARDFEPPETRVGICCGCRQDGMALYRIPELLRWRCDACFEREQGYRHRLSPPRDPSRIVLLQ